MAIAPFLVQIRTAGAAALNRVGNNFRRLAANIRVAANAWRNSFIARGGIPGALRRLPNALRNAARQFRNLAQNARQAARALILYALTSRLAVAASQGLVKVVTMALPVLAKWAAIVGAAAAVAFPLIGVLGNLAPAAMLIVPAIASAGLALVGLKLAFNGVGAALQAGLSGDAEEFEKALKKLAPQAADTVRALVKLRDVWKPLARDFQGRVFEGAAAEVMALSKFIKPVADKWLPKLALRFAEVRNELAEGLARFAADGRLEAVWRNIHVAVSAVLSAVKPLAQAFGDILQVAAPRFASLAENIAIAAGNFAEWIRAARDSGKLGEWLDRAVYNFGLLKEIAGNLGELFAAIFRVSSDDGESFLQKLVRITQAMADWANSGSGQKIIDTMAKIVGWILACEPAFKVVVAAVDFAVGAFKALLVVGQAVWGGLVQLVKNAITLILEQLGYIVNGAAAAFGWIPGIGDKLKAAANKFNEFRDNVNNSLNGINKTIDITVNYRARMIGNHMVSGAQQSGTYSSGIGGRAVGGPMRGGVMYRVNEQGQEFIQLGTSGRAYNARESAAMASPGGGVPAWSGSMSGLDALFFRWFNQAVRTGKLKPV